MLKHGQLAPIPRRPLARTTRLVASITLVAHPRQLVPSARPGYGHRNAETQKGPHTWTCWGSHRILTMAAPLVCRPGAPAPSSSYPMGRISVPLPDPNCASNHPSPINRHLQLSRQESFSKPLWLIPTAPICYPPTSLLGQALLSTLAQY